MIVVFRADASRAIGSGHIMRCLTLADRLRGERQARVLFICRELEGHLADYIRSRGYETHVLPRPPGAAGAGSGTGEPAHAHWLEVPWTLDAGQTAACLSGLPEPADWLVFDHYALDSRYEESMRPYARRLMAIDDLADRPHRCDLLLDQNWDGEAGFRYRERIRPGTRLLIGPSYALLRDEFAARRSRVVRDGTVRHVLVSFGGVDLTGETEKALEALIPFAREGVKLTVLAGRSNPRAGRIEALCASLPNTRCYLHADNMADLMLEADLAVGAGGSSTWERCCLGLPAVTVAAAANQESLSQRAAQAGAALYLGRSADVDAARIREAVRSLRDGPHRLLWMSVRAMELTDGRGAERTVKEMLG